MIVDDTASPPRVLAGRRAPAHVFMAGKLVFPGGRIDRTDLALAGHFPLPPAVGARLGARTARRFGEKRAAALALAAIRETFEETGIMLGAPGEFSSRAPYWRDFAACGVRPMPAKLVPFARAITPPGLVRRYDTRFFAVRAETIVRRMPFEDRPTDEFDQVAWMTIDEMQGEDLAPITRQVLAELAARLESASLYDPEMPMAFYRRQGGVFLRDLL
ncbi:NUDIX domain-containing protein [Aureimonas populi]|uniref:NUDIX domain-containing protein n=1 Tax=Aureimonas populi TaxID=1701758 RepID=A0ABW5CK86_9HYPH|nr:NUDIX hydrolase [Aureimonas populi]